jgi:hypothetical protein
LTLHASHSQLEIFIDLLYPAAEAMRAFVAKSSQVTAESKRAEAFMVQLWQLFVSFCKSPTDADTQFARIAQPIGKLLNDDVQLRPIVCTALSELIQSYKAEEDTNAIHLDAISGFAKNYIPLLFNVIQATTKLPNSPAVQKQQATLFRTLSLIVQIAPLPVGVTALCAQYDDSHLGDYILVSVHDEATRNRVCRTADHVGACACTFTSLGRTECSNPV